MILTAIILLLGTWEVLRFSDYNRIFHLGFLKFSIVPGIPFILHILLNWHSISHRLFPETVDEHIELNTGRVHYFERKFQNLEVEEIDRRLEGGLVDEARHALEKIKNQKNETQHRTELKSKL